MKKQKTNWVLTIVLILGTLTVFFPLYMAVIIAFKKPSEMTNDVAGALSFPSKWSFSNFTEAMKVTDFWHSLGNSLLITIVTIVLAILIHSVAGYVIGRGMARKKSFRFIYLYIVSGMFVPFSKNSSLWWRNSVRASLAAAISARRSSESKILALRFGSPCSSSCAGIRYHR